MRMCNKNNEYKQVTRSASLRLSSDSLSGVSNDIRLNSFYTFPPSLSILWWFQTFREKILAWKSSPPRTPKRVIIEEQVNFDIIAVFLLKKIGWFWLLSFKVNVFCLSLFFANFWWGLLSLDCIGLISTLHQLPIMISVGHKFQLDTV